MKVLKNARGMNALNPELCTHALRTRLHIQSVIRHYQGAEQKTLREEWKSRAGCDFWRQWNMSRFGMQEKKLHAWWHQESEGSLFQKKRLKEKNA